MLDDLRHDQRYDAESAGGRFMMGLLAGTVIGAGLGVLFAPKSGAEVREAIGERARHAADWGTQHMPGQAETDGAPEAVGDGVDDVRDGG